MATPILYQKAWDITLDCIKYERIYPEQLGQNLFNAVGQLRDKSTVVMVVKAIYDAASSSPRLTNNQVERVARLLFALCKADLDGGSTFFTNVVSEIHYTKPKKSPLSSFLKKNDTAERIMRTYENLSAM